MIEDFLEDNITQTDIKVVGVGNGGLKVLEYLSNNNFVLNCPHYACELIYIDSDESNYKTSNINSKLFFSKTTFRLEGGLDYLSFFENRVKSLVNGSDMVFIVCGAGGETSSIVAPIVSKVCKEMNILATSICSKPFAFEDERKKLLSIVSLREIREHSDSLIVVPAQRLIQIVGEGTKEYLFSNLAKFMGNYILNIISIIASTGIINIDFCDIAYILKNSGTSFIGWGFGAGKDGHLKAVKKAIYSPLLEVSLGGAKNAIVHILCSQYTSLAEINDILDEIRNENSDLNIIFGASMDSCMKQEEYYITVVASGYEEKSRGYGIHDIAEAIFSNDSINNITYDGIENDKISSNNVIKDKCEELLLPDVKFLAVSSEEITPNDYGLINLVMFKEEYEEKVLKSINDLVCPGVAINGAIDVRVVLHSPELTITNNNIVQKWNDKYLKFSFYFYLPVNYNKKSVMFEAVVYFNNVVATTLNFKVEVNKNPKVSMERKDFKSAFISYASVDRDEAVLIVQGITSSRPDLEIFFDVNSIRTGENWEEVIKDELSKKDVLFLLWSRNAQSSEWVKKEWTYFYENKGIDYIEPIPLEPVDKCPPPQELNSKHFGNMLVFLRK